MEGTIGEIRMFAATFAPKSWAFCNGATIAISSNTALFSILGTTYGGNGTTNFQLPNCQSRVVLGTGTSTASGSVYALGQTGGAETVTLTTNNLPAHTHALAGSVAMRCSNGAGEESSSLNAYPALSNSSRYLTSGTTVNMQSADLSGLTYTNAGNGQPFGIVKPYNSVYYIICQYGVFPQRS